MTAPNVTIPQADAIIEQLRAEIHQLIGTEYRDAAIQAWEDAVVARDEAQAAAESAKTGAPAEGWVRGDLHADVLDSLSRADSALQSVPVATPDAPGTVQLDGDLTGTAQAPRVRGLADKLDEGDTAEAGASPISTPSKIIRHSAAGELVANERPQSNRDAASHMWVAEQIGTRAPSEHRHDHRDIDNLDALIDERARALVEAHGPRIERVTALPDTPDPDTLYYVVEVES